MAELVEKVLDPKKPLIVRDLLELLEVFADADFDLRITKNGQCLIEKLRVEWFLKGRFVRVEYVTQT